MSTAQFWERQAEPCR